MCIEVEGDQWEHVKDKPLQENLQAESLSLSPEKPE